MKTIYIPMSMTSWEALSSKELPKTKFFAMERLGISFLPCFDSIETLRKYYPNAEIIELQYNDSN